jgi:hypothetical protein
LGYSKQLQDAMRKQARSKELDIGMSEQAKDTYNFLVE